MSWSTEQGRISSKSLRKKRIVSTEYSSLPLSSLFSSNYLDLFNCFFSHDAMTGRQLLSQDAHYLKLRRLRSNNSVNLSPASFEGLASNECAVSHAHNQGAS